MTETLLAVMAAPREGGDATMIFLVQMGLIFAIFYFLLIRPQKKEKARHEQMIASLKKGQEIVTAGGIIGKVVHAEDDRITIKTAENTRLVVQRSKVSQVMGTTDSA